MPSRHRIIESPTPMASNRVPCQFKNLQSNSNAARMICKNINDKLVLKRMTGVQPFQVSEIEQLCSYDRSTAYFIRHYLRDILTSDHAYVWFYIQTKPLDSLENRKHILKKADVQEIHVDYSFGSMLNYGTFIEHTHERALAQMFIQKSARSMVLKTGNCVFAIPLENIDRQLLINHTTDDESIRVIFMLKAPPIIQKRTENNLNTNRLVDEVGLCSDLLVRFFPASQAWSFLHELPIAGYSDRPGDELFHINFSRFDSRLHSSIDVPLGKPQYSTEVDNYGVEMLWSLGYTFRDKYVCDQGSFFGKKNQQQKLYDVFCTMWYKLKENHCYRLQDAWNDAKERSADLIASKDGTKTETVAFAILTPNRIEYQPKRTIAPHRGFQFYPSENWLLVHMRDYDGKNTIFCLDDTTRIRFKQYMVKGIPFRKNSYRYFGSSNSQVKDQAAWFLALPPDQHQSIHQVREAIGNLSSIKNIPTYISRVGLFLTTAKDTELKLDFKGEILDGAVGSGSFWSRMKKVLSKWLLGKKPNIDLVAFVIPDEQRNGYCFTDGCGKISRGLAREVAKRIGIKVTKEIDVPSAFQVRIAGCKGMLMVDPESKSTDFYIKVRQSMKKFDADNWSLHIVDHSRPMPLSLNNQVIRLLSDLGNSNGVFESIQSRCLETDGFWHPPAGSYLSAIETADQTLMDQKRQKYQNAKHLLLKNKIPLPLNDGRNLFGVADVTGQLKSGQCFIQYRDLNYPSGQQFQIVQGTVLVTKNPCLHPGDFRKLQAVWIDTLADHIRDCIVFSTQGFRPNFDEIAGSDLDGDQYWVYWGTELEIKTVAEPLAFPAATKKNVNQVTNDFIIDHVLDTFTDKAPGVISNTHAVIADKDPMGTRSDACRECAQLFARAIDARKTGEEINMNHIKILKEKYCRDYPAWMMKFDKPCMEPPSTSINEILFRKAVQARIRDQDLEDILRPLPDVYNNQDATILDLGEIPNDGVMINSCVLKLCRFVALFLSLLVWVGIFYLFKYLYSMLLKGKH